MILSEFIKKCYTFSLEKIKNSNSNKEKREIVTELLTNIISSGVKYSERLLVKTLGVSRQLIHSILCPSDYVNDEEKIETRGRKKVEDKDPTLVEKIKLICEEHEFVDSGLQDNIVYLDITLRGVKSLLESEYECSLSIGTISRILTEKLDYKITKIKKDKVFKKIKETNSIFENVWNKLKDVKKKTGKIIAISIDDKVSKYIGELANNSSKSRICKRALDHDTNPDAIVKPFGIMDLITNQVYVFCTLGTSTADFKVNCIKEYLFAQLKANPNAKKLMIFLDNGPENSSRRKLWKYCLIKLAMEYNIYIELVYYPPYHSKYNKIEHFWGVLQRNWNRLIIDNLTKLIASINGTKWHDVNAKGYLKTEIYEKGQKVDEKELKELEKKHIVYGKKNIAKWSMIILP